MVMRREDVRVTENSSFFVYEDKIVIGRMRKIE